MPSLLGKKWPVPIGMPPPPLLPLSNLETDFPAAKPMAPFFAAGMPSFPFLQIPPCTNHLSEQINEVFLNL